MSSVENKIFLNKSNVALPKYGIWIIYSSDNNAKIPIIGFNDNVAYLLNGYEMGAGKDNVQFAAEELQGELGESDVKFPIVFTGPFTNYSAASNFKSKFPNQALLVKSNQPSERRRPTQQKGRPMPTAKPSLNGISQRIVNKIFWNNKNISQAPTSGIWVLSVRSSYPYILEFKDRYTVVTHSVEKAGWNSVEQSIITLRSRWENNSNWPLVFTGPFNSVSNACKFIQATPNQASAEFAKAAIAMAFAKKQSTAAVNGLGFGLFGENDMVVDEKVTTVVTGTPQVTDDSGTHQDSSSYVLTPTVRVDSTGTPLTVQLPDTSAPTTDVTTESMKVDVVANQQDGTPVTVANVSVSPDGQMVTTTPEVQQALQQAIDDVKSGSILDNKKFQLAVAALVIIWLVRR